MFQQQCKKYKLNVLCVLRVWKSWLKIQAIINFEVNLFHRETANDKTAKVLTCTQRPSLAGFPATEIEIEGCQKA